MSKRKKHEEQGDAILEAMRAGRPQDDREARRKQLSRQRFLLRFGLVGFAIAGVAGYLISGDPLPIAWLGMVLGVAAGWGWLRVR
ncbi:hypothetical protein NA655_13935 [Pseudomonas kuykendallii]|uniref:Uncharacterized protein n=1 Tax=Pseudomonas kuykendallii TaxID=1007099 RepID=A0A1H2T8G3_9PSED|nr:hypothetical protein [Pseudomonas kuykendallii]MCQ4272124.1 hypothetical protein [Pseudomonas kuykendallii]SDW40236.1 hypothetical protein SAMN05216287_0909 [Pseudomonas kuykendallii]